LHGGGWRNPSNQKRDRLLKNDNAIFTDPDFEIRPAGILKHFVPESGCKIIIVYLQFGSDCVKRA